MIRTTVGQQGIGPAQPEGEESRELYAALDLGTNSCRLLVAAPAPGGFRIVDAYSRATRLGEGLAATGLLCEAAIGRTVVALRNCRRRIERRGATRSRLVATEACRRAANCDAFLARVEGEAGLRLEIISAYEEARLTLAGCAVLVDPDCADALVFDIGGGSTELIHARRDAATGEVAVASMMSAPVGVVTLGEERGGARLSDPAVYAEAVAEVTARLSAFDASGALAELARAGRLQLLGTSGTVTTLAGVHLDLARYDRRAVDGLDMEIDVVTRTSRRLVAATAGERDAHPCIGPGRADLAVAGCAILDAILSLWPVQRLRVADRGLREGLLVTMIAERPAA